LRPGAHGAGSITAMSTRAMDVWMRAHAGALHEPTTKRVRVTHVGQTIAETERALLVWEPRRIVPSYAVPVDDLRVELIADAVDLPEDDGRPFLSPGTPFTMHTMPGESLTVRSSAPDRAAAAFRPADADLDGYVVLDFFSFDAWFEEDERIVGYPRDPFKRIDVRRSSRHVRIEVDGHVLAESYRPMLLFETGLPTRYYLPRDDVLMDLLRPTSTRTWCAYKGEAAYWSLELDEQSLEDLAWTYESPLSDAVAVANHVAFFNERVDVIVDGTRSDRPTTEFAETGWQAGTRR
jgi:uncharacterized protein (DUF427 family)